jgi:hypothetical protein
MSSGSQPPSGMLRQGARRQENRDLKEACFLVPCHYFMFVLFVMVELQMRASHDEPTDSVLPLWEAVA